MSKKIGLFILVFVLIIGIGGVLVSLKDVGYGEEGFINRGGEKGISINENLSEGTYFVAPWNELITYNILDQSKTFNLNVNDNSEVPIAVELSLMFNTKKDEVAKFHLKLGERYPEYIEAESLKAIKTILNRHSYEEIYSTKRAEIEAEIEGLLTEKFDSKSLFLSFVEITSVTLPKSAMKALLTKEAIKEIH